MKRTIMLVDKKTNKHRKFIVDVNWQSLIGYVSSGYMDTGKFCTIPGVTVWETDNIVVQPKITPKTDYVKLACDLEVGDIIPFAQTVSGGEIVKKFASLNIKVECCPVPKDVSAFGAVKVIGIKRD